MSTRSSYVCFLGVLDHGTTTVLIVPHHVSRAQVKLVDPIHGKHGGTPHLALGMPCAAPGHARDRAMSPMRTRLRMDDLRAGVSDVRALPRIPVRLNPASYSNQPNSWCRPGVLRCMDRTPRRMFAMFKTVLVLEHFSPKGYTRGSACS